MRIWYLFTTDRDSGDDAVGCFSTLEKAMAYADETWKNMFTNEWNVWKNGATRSFDRWSGVEIDPIELDPDPHVDGV